MIECNLGKRLGKQYIIIECKDWNSKIEIGQMGTFINLVESINAVKGIYVSKKGFQSGAIKKANASSKILTKTLEDINEIEILNWTDYDTFFKWMIYINSKAFTIEIDSEIPFLAPEIDNLKNYEIHIPSFQIKENLYEHSLNVAKFFLKSNSKLLFKKVIEEKGHLFDCFQIKKEFNHKEAFIEKAKIKYPLKRMSIHVGIALTSELSNKFATKVYKDSNKNIVEATVLTVDFKNDKMNLIKTDSDDSFDAYLTKNQNKLDYLKFRFGNWM